MRPWAWTLIGAVGGAALAILVGKWLGLLGGIAVAGGFVGAVAGSHARELKRSRAMRKEILATLDEAQAILDLGIAEKASQERSKLDDMFGAP